MTKVQQIQTVLGVTPDDHWGPLTQAALDDLLHPIALPEGEPRVKASSFADPADVLAFKRCKAQGRTDQECFAVGDNGIGCWGDDCTKTVPMCALPPEDYEERWGSRDGAKHKLVEVAANGRVVICLCGDVMPHRARITNGAGIDLNPEACARLGLHPPVMTTATWKWSETQPA